MTERLQGKTAEFNHPSNIGVIIKKFIGGGNLALFCPKLNHGIGVVLRKKPYEGHNE